jgi:hypothetical protein
LPRYPDSTRSHKLSSILFTVCRKYGNKFSSRQISRLVFRENGHEESYSRTEINALSILYREYPDHIRSLKLPELFADRAAGLPRYFCQLIEKFPKSLEEIFYFCSEELDLRIGDWEIPKEGRDRLFDKLANRGDSALLDFTCKVS